MEFSEALRRHLPLQVRVPVHTNPLETTFRYAAEVFMVETGYGPGVIWLDPFWCNGSPEVACHIAYASPNGDAGEGRWVDNDPRYGPKCLVCQKPFVIEQLDRESPAWPEYKAWRLWREGKAEQCGRKAAWAQARAAFRDLIVERRV